MRDNAGALADIVVLVVALDDGCLSQTFEVLDSIIEARMPLLLVLNKMDTPDAVANLRKVRTQLAERGLHFSTPRICNCTVHLSLIFLFILGLLLMDHSQTQTARGFGVVQNQN